ncbi:L-2-amino-thiazoline-4-carboxylic acid hydrolase [Candidatus Latescibacterota bacterium]
MKVESLERYNKSFGDAPKELIKLMQKEFLGKLLKRFGFLGIIGFFVRVMREKKKLMKEYAKEYNNLVKTVPNPKLIGEFVYIAAVFNALLKYETRDSAYEYLKWLLEGVWKESLMMMYQVDDLLKCEGDIFDNFKKINIGTFNSSSIEYNVKEINETENHLNIVVDKCLNVELANTFGVPELGKIGCDHDIVAFPPVEEKTNSVFRRPCNLAKDGKHCDFHFYRKGFEPEGPYEIH